MKEKYYSLKKILSKNAVYNIIIGLRSNGKTYACKQYGIENYFKHGKQFAYLRRWDEDFKKDRGKTLFNDMIENGFIEKISKGKYNTVLFKYRKWYFAKNEYNENGDLINTIQDEKPFAFAFALTNTEHDKSTSYPNITTIIFDEFLTKARPLDDEFLKFTATLSTIARNRTDIKVFMLGNTVSPYSIYFDEMGITNIKNMKIGTIDVYEYGMNSELLTAVEYASPTEKTKENEYLFAFNNPALKMITSSEWEMDIYPHCPTKYKTKNILTSFFVVFYDDILQGDLILIEHSIFVFIHRKTTEIQNPKRDLIYTNEYDYRYNYHNSFTKPKTRIEQIILDCYNRNKFFYQDNKIGDMFDTFLKQCK